METQTHETSKATVILGIVAVVFVFITIALVAVCLPYFGLDLPFLPAVTEAPAQVTAAPTAPPTEAPTEPPTEPEPTLPPPEANPYGPLDFQYEDNFLYCQEADTIPGIDVSAYQHDIDWEAVKADGVEFAMIRLGYRGYESGKLVEDKYVHENLAGAAAAGLKIGVYFFSQAITPAEAEEEAYWVLDFIKDLDVTMPVVYDWEHVSDANARTKDMDRRTLTDCCLAFLATIEAAGYHPMVYFNSHQARSDLYLSELKEYDFWLAAYTDRMTFPYKIRMWQYTCTGKVDGIAGDVDINLYFTEE